MLEFSHIKDFYVLLAVLELARQHPFSKPWEKLEEDTTEHLNMLVENLSLAARDYLVLACFGESRHAMTSMGIRHYPNLMLFQDGLYRGEAMWEATRFDPVKSMPGIIKIFEHENWNGGGYGGRKWQNVAKAAFTYWNEFAGMPVAFLDHVADVQHNGGTAFSKPEAKDITTNAAMSYWHDGNYGIQEWLSWKSHAVPKHLVANSIVMMSKTNRIAQRLCILSMALRHGSVFKFASRYDTQPDALDNIQYEPIQWGTETLEVIEKKVPKGNYASQQHVMTLINWDSLQDVKLPKNWANPDVKVFGKVADQYEKDVHAAAKLLIAEWIKKFPAKATILRNMAKARVESHIKKAMGERIKLISEAYTKDVKAIVKEMSEGFDDAEYPTWAALQTAKHTLIESMRERLGDFVLKEVPPFLQSKVKSNADYELLRTDLGIAYCKRVYEVDYSYVELKFRTIEHRMNRFYVEIVTPSGNMRRPETIQQLINGMYHSLSLYHGYGKTRLIGEARTVFKEGVSRILNERRQEILNRKEAMQRYGSYGARIQTPPEWEPTFPTPAEEQAVKTPDQPVSTATNLSEPIDVLSTLYTKKHLIQTAWQVKYPINQSDNDKQE